MKRMLQLAVIAIVLPFAGQATLAYPSPNYCGDPCSVEGERAGCRCNGFRDICTCINGRWSTLP